MSSSCSSPIYFPEALRLLHEQHDSSIIEDNLNLLQNSSDPWDLVEKNWTVTAVTRLKKLMTTNESSIATYMTEYPALKKPTGYLLVRMKYTNYMKIFHYSKTKFYNWQMKK